MLGGNLGSLLYGDVSVMQIRPVTQMNKYHHVMKILSLRFYLSFFTIIPYVNVWSITLWNSQFALLGL